MPEMAGRQGLMTADVHNLVTRKNIGFAKDLLQSLVPRAQCFCFYGLDRTCVWSSDGADDYEIDNFVGELPEDILRGTSQDSRLLRRTLPSGRTLLVMPVDAGGEYALGILVSVYSRNAGKSSWFNPTMLGDILRPAIRVIGENLRLNGQAARADERAAAAEKELQLVYQVDEKIHGMSRSHAGLAQLIGQSGRFLGISYSVLLMPSKRIRISATHSSWKSVNRKALDRYLVESLFRKIEGQHSPAVFEVPAVAGSDNPAEQGYQAMLCPLLDGAGNLEGVIAQFGRVSGRPFNDAHKRFMSHIVRKVEYVIEQSFDAMTGLMNRSGFEAQIHESTKSLVGEEDAHQLIYFDLDNLQLVNDSFDRAAGDEVIVRFAQLIEDHIPSNAVATRLTDDDFVILLTHSTVNESIELTEAIRKESQVLRYLRGDKSLQITVSAGIAELSRKTPAGDALTASRIACEAAKDHGRDRYEVHDRENQSIIQRYDDMYLVSEIQKSLDTDGFLLTAQPIVSLAGDDSRSRFEILLRMRDDKGNRVSSDAFFSAAERYQLMPQVDRWVVSSTLSRLSNFRDFLEETGAVFAINLSGQSLGDDALLSFIEDEIDRTGVPTKSLCFEVTESAAVSSRDKAGEFIDALRDRGCRFSLDDFGAGLSSFAYLKSFNVDILKIDGGFIRDITDNRISESMVAAITQVAKVMELETVAEYVENDGARKLLARLGVDFAQGHAIGKPADLDDVLARLTTRKRISTA
jgi:diguanylate cyclase (GGDEF)-like protein